MRKEILALLMVLMVTTPCFSQEIEPANFFRLENTFWSIEPNNTTPFIGFYRGNVYSCDNRNGSMCSTFQDGNYVDLFWIGLPSFFNLGDMFVWGRGWAIPILGTGRVTFEGLGNVEGNYRMMKILDPWFPTS